MLLRSGGGILFLLMISVRHRRKLDARQNDLLEADAITETESILRLLAICLIDSEVPWVNSCIEKMLVFIRTALTINS